VLEPLKNPVAFFFAMIVVFSAASLPSSPPVLMAAKANPPWLVATLGAVAAGLAALADYHVVRRAFRLQTLDRVRRHPLFERAERWAKVAPFFTVAVFAATPLPFWIPWVLVPLSGYSLPRYALAVAVGRWPRVFVIAAFGQLVDIPAWLLDAALVAAVTVAAAGALVRRVHARRTPEVTPPPPPPSPEGGSQAP
jgi:uncharacterized membrane protein YdjX (TVP38/TMEM64 family)